MSGKAVIHYREYGAFGGPGYSAFVPRYHSQVNGTTYGKTRDGTIVAAAKWALNHFYTTIISGRRGIQFIEPFFQVQPLNLTGPQPPGDGRPVITTMRCKHARQKFAWWKVTRVPMQYDYDEGGDPAALRVAAQAARWMLERMPDGDIENEFFKSMFEYQWVS